MTRGSKPVPIALATSFLFFADCGADSKSAPDAGDTGADSGPEQGTWTDTITGLIWQDPPSAEIMTWFEAAGVNHETYNPEGADYCGSLDWDGHQDWRLPRIQELISLLRGCVDQEPTGGGGLSTCLVSDPDCLGWACADSVGCGPCPPNEGPGVDGCYCVPMLSGPCLWFWSSSTSADNAGSAWVVIVKDGSVSQNGKGNGYHARCVRDP